MSAIRALGAVSSGLCITEPVERHWTQQAPPPRHPAVGGMLVAHTWFRWSAPLHHGEVRGHAARGLGEAEVGGDGGVACESR